MQSVKRDKEVEGGNIQKEKYITVVPKNINKDKLGKFNSYTDKINNLEKKKVEQNNRFSKNTQIYVNLTKEKSANGKIKIIKNESNNKLTNSATMKNINENSRQIYSSKLNLAKSQGKFITFNNLKNHIDINNDFDSYSNVSPRKSPKKLINRRSLTSLTNNIKNEK